MDAHTFPTTHTLVNQITLKLLPMTIENRAAYQLSINEQKQVAELLAGCFPHYPTGKTFFRQIPHFHLLVRSAQQELWGQLSVEYRQINNQGQIMQVFGIADLCVLPQQRNKGIASKLIAHLEALAINNGVEAIITFAGKQKVYLKNGFVAAENECKWLFIQGDESMGVLKRRIPGGLMVKMLNEKSWQGERLDLLGHIF